MLKCYVLYAILSIMLMKEELLKLTILNQLRAYCGVSFFLTNSMTFLDAFFHDKSIISYSIHKSLPKRNLFLIKY